MILAYIGIFAALFLSSDVNGQCELNTAYSATAYLNENCGGLSIPYDFTTDNACTAPQGLASCYYRATCQGVLVAIDIFGTAASCDGTPAYEVNLEVNSACQQ